jgi:hypothetical protein
MNDKKLDLRAVSEEIEDLVPVSRDFEDRCVAAAFAAYSIARMRDERQRMERDNQTAPGTNFLGIPIEKYVQGLGHFAEVETDSVFAWAGIREHGRVELADAVGWGLLLRHLGVLLEQALMLTRISFADRMGYPIQMAVARLESNRYGNEPAIIDTLEEYRQASEEVESDYPQSCRQELNDILDAIEASYRYSKL